MAHNGIQDKEENLSIPKWQLILRKETTKCTELKYWIEFITEEMHNKFAPNQFVTIYRLNKALHVKAMAISLDQTPC